MTDRTLRILLLAYRFPPQGGIGVHRPAKMVKTWARSGHRVVVITSPVKGSKYVDEALLREIPSTVEVHTAADFSVGPVLDKLRERLLESPLRPLAKPMGYLQAWVQLWAIPDPRDGWLWPSFFRTVKVARTFRPDVIVVTGPPWTPAISAALASRRTGIPFVLDYRDPWSESYFRRPLPQLSLKVNPTIERWVLARAGGVTAAHREIIRRIRPLFSKRRPLCMWVPNGYDAEDFSQPAEIPPDRFTLTYAGSFLTYRVPKVFIETLEAMMKEGLIDPSRFSLRLAGHVDVVKKFCDPAGPLLRSIDFRGYVSHEESIRLLQGSTANLILEIGVTKRNFYVPAKVYEVFAARRPVLLLCPEGTTPHLSRSIGGVWIAHPESVTEIRSAVLAMYDAWQRGTLRTRPNPARLAFYTRPHQAFRMAKLLARVGDARQRVTRTRADAGRAPVHRR
jgi:glycosyltransferase involved in cell wall biosynthesis